VVHGNRGKQRGRGSAGALSWVQSLPPPPSHRNHVLTAGSALAMTELIVVLVSSFLIGFCATDVVWHRINTGSWL
jgi:hypothetical protein